jgi:hypothetical protein
VVKKEHIILAPVFRLELVKSSREFNNLAGNILTQAVEHFIECFFVIAMPAGHYEYPDLSFGVCIFDIEKKG